MRSFARFLLILTLVIWVGGIVFFSFVVAPLLFSLLGSQAMAGNVVSHSLDALHYMGLACGVVFLAATFLTVHRSARALRGLICLMLLCTVVSEFGVIPQMHRIRQAVGGSIELLPRLDAGRVVFDHLHQFSVALETTTLLAGLGLIGILSRDDRS